MTVSIVFVVCRILSPKIFMAKQEVELYSPTQRNNASNIIILHGNITLDQAILHLDYIFTSDPPDIYALFCYFIFAAMSTKMCVCHSSN